MSAASPITPSVDWVVSLGSILGIIVSISVVGAAVVKIISYIRQNIKKEVVSTREDLMKQISWLEDKIDVKDREMKELIQSKVVSGKERVDDMKWWMEKIQKEVEDNTRMISQLTESQGKLAVEVAKIKTELEVSEEQKVH